ncbi:hypothetical protein N0V82_006449 [Gnomoniopsis sp. IMI 355080]|nr:hypothetical protein N0V82_006449 [Gnomoniopsis sp. IMI 355080]
MCRKGRCLRLAMLNADTSTPNVYANMGTFGDILHRVLAEAAWRIDEDLKIDYAVFDVVKSEYPGSLLDFDVILITASAASSYHQEPWIQNLEQYIVKLYRDHADIKIFGSCFGHHIISQALLKDQGLRVEKSPKGWEIGISQVALTDEFRKAYAASIEGNLVSGFDPYTGRLPSPDDDSNDARCACFRNRVTSFEIPQTVRLQFVHEDQVVMPYKSTSLSSPWVLLGSTEHCAVQGVYLPGRVLTLQGHFEFDKFESGQTERIFGADGGSVEENTTACSRRDGTKTDEMDDGYLVAEMVVRFFCEAGGQDGMRNFEQQETLPTPRTSIEMS